MSYEESICIKIDVNEIKKDNVEELWLMFQYFIICYMSSIINLGVCNTVTSEAKMAFNEFYCILKKEKDILNIIFNNCNKLDFDEVVKFLNDLDILNEKTFNYYYSIFDNIEDAIETKEEYRAKRSKKSFRTLIETDEYERRLTKKLT